MRGWLGRGGRGRGEVEGQRGDKGGGRREEGGEVAGERISVGVWVV